MGHGNQIRSAAGSPANLKSKDMNDFDYVDFQLEVMKSKFTKGKKRQKIDALIKQVEGDNLGGFNKVGLLATNILKSAGFNARMSELIEFLTKLNKDLRPC